MNALSVDSCQRLGILFEDLVASCELVNSSRVQVQVTGVVPTIAIDKCDGVQVRFDLNLDIKSLAPGLHSRHCQGILKG